MAEILKGIISILLILLIGCVYCGKKVTPTLTYQYDNGEIYVFDNLMKDVILHAMENFLKLNSTYKNFQHDPHEKDRTIITEGNLHWKAIMSPSLLIKTRLWGAVRNAYKSLPEHVTHGRKYIPYVAYGTMLARGDFTSVFQGDVEHPDSIFIRVYLTAGIKRNDYSDHTFYDDHGEIIASIHPKFGRVIMWTGNVSTILRPPAMGCELVEHSFIIKINPDTNLFSEACDVIEESAKKSEEYKVTPLPYTNQVNKFDFFESKGFLDDHVVRKYYDSQMNVVAVFDNLIPKALLDALRSFVSQYDAKYTLATYDPATSETHDNVNWIAQMNTEIILNTPYWEVIKRVAGYLSNTTEWYPYDVSTNLIWHTHHTRIHIDCVNKENEYTFLLYLNPNWSENMYAETTFFEEILDPSNPGIGSSADEEYNFIASVVPRFGRIAIFRNLIPHSARPPSPNHLAGRYSFPVKLSETYRQARAKTLSEALYYKRENDAEDEWYPDLRKAIYKPYHTDERREWVEEHIKKMKNAKQSSIDEAETWSKNVLFPKQFRS